ncbi:MULTISPECIES: hypothetical protein [unclassified Colwellia]|uniref:hypothetical protein n=1 Tax=unclassified Colwellia TaxID=196834 RepID=UPI0015F5CCF8|nr:MULTISPECIES: hypothetical protein [unclassified Colwellia]MBA6233209.1 hypothetical protein [Colwellia sp. MB02u-7]MBA6236299.1 hypothetical protein [Colwellia sp. MB02u-11]MBA6298301.1 hypothetical protein [Colwellia sp. MB3u-22]MBA6311874.1 hypothetical protein [Colwellia sp. MB3u-64]
MFYLNNIVKVADDVEKYPWYIPSYFLSAKTTTFDGESAAFCLKACIVKRAEHEEGVIDFD